MFFVSNLSRVRELKLWRYAISCDVIYLRQQDPGVIPRLCKGLFEAIGALGQGKTVAVVASYVEVRQRLTKQQWQ